MLVVAGAGAHALDAVTVEEKEWDQAIKKFMGCSTEASTQKSTAVAWGWWVRFCVLKLKISPVWKPCDCPVTNLKREWAVMRFAVFLMSQPSINTGTTPGVYISLVKSKFRDDLGVRMLVGEQLRLPSVLKGMRRVFSANERTRLPVTRPILLGIRGVCEKMEGSGVPWWAVCTTAFQALMRGAEAVWDPKAHKVWNPELQLTRADLTFHTDCAEPYALLRMHPLKTPGSKGKKDCLVVLPFDGTEVVCAARALQEMVDRDPVPKHLEGSTPLFRDSKTHQTLTVDGLMQVVRAGAMAVGVDPELVGTHSLRIGGATALFEAGETPLVIQTMGRWASDLYRLYVRACRGKLMQALKKQAKVNVLLLQPPDIDIEA